MDASEKESIQSHHHMEHIATSDKTQVMSVDVDDEALRSMGYQPQMKREFNVLQLFGTAFTVTASWLGVVGGFSTGILVGGPPTLIYGIIIVTIANVFIVTALSELMSAMPNAGGQYYWALKLAPPRLARPSAYFTGLCNLAAGLAASTGSLILQGSMIMGCVKLFCPDLELKPWQSWLIGVGLNYGVAIINFSEKAFARTMFVSLVVSLLAFAIVTVVTPAISPAHPSPKWIFTSTENISGWSAYGMAFLVGLLNANYAYGLIDSSVHLAEEIPHPEKNVPKVLYATVAIGFLTSFPLAILLLYSIVDYEAISTTETLVPLLELFYQVCRGNKAGAVIMLLLVEVPYLIALVSIQGYQARLCWSFARDNGLPFSHLWSQVNPKLGVPVKAHVLCVTFTSILSLLSLASTTAFNSLAVAVAVFPSMSYILPVIYSMLPRNRNVKGSFNAGIFGKISKVGTIIFSIFTIVIYSFPTYMPAKGSDMNYISAIIGAVIIFALSDWLLRARKTFNVCED